MAREYRAPITINKFVMWANWLGLGPSQTLTTTGRISGESRSVPVAPIIVDGEEYLVAPYGEASWVHNVRADPAVTLRTGRRERRCELVEVTDQAAHVVKAYWDKERIPRRHMDMPSNPTLEDFAAVAGRFPVFQVDEKG